MALEDELRKGHNQFIERLKESHTSRVASLLDNNAPALRELDFRGFLADLQATEYTLQAEDMVLMEESTTKLEEHWREAYNMRGIGTRIAKCLELPAIVLYETVAKTFGKDRGVVDHIWQEYLKQDRGNTCVYGTTPQAIIAAFQNHGNDIGAALLYLQFGRPKMFKGEMIAAGNAAYDAVREREERKLARDIIAHAGSQERARYFVSALSQRGLSAIDVLREDITKKGFMGVLDYFSNGSALWDFELFAKKFDAYIVA